VLITTAGLAASRAARRWPHLLIVIAANLALFYAAANQAGLLDALANSID
jgi:hypothetical protein